MNDDIILSEYNPNWPSMYAAEEKHLRQALGNKVVDIQHIGSTSVPGLVAKPIIDIMITVKKLGPASEYADALAKLEYINDPHDDDDVRLFFRKGEPRAFHLHIVAVGSVEDIRHIEFRNYLRVNSRGRDEYANLKKAMAQQFKADREAYTLSKTAFIAIALANLGTSR
jgi:GrpB-like predicted nucleotidyltransferase (UPF0157 family)